METTLLNRNMKSVYRQKVLGVKGITGSRRAKLFTIVLCSEDSRVDLTDLFDLVPGEVHVLRTAGPIVTNDVMRSILAILAVETVDAIIVLGNTDPLLADPRLLGDGYSKLVRQLPDRSPYTAMLSTREKARSYWATFQDPMQNVFVQVSNLSFLKRMYPGMLVTGMLCNVSNGHVYGFDELREMKALLDKNPKTRLDSIVPKRYHDFEKEQRSKERSLVPAGGPAGKAKVPAPPVPAPERSLFEEAFDLEPLNLEPSGTAMPRLPADMEDDFSATREQVELFMDVVKKTMSRGLKVKVFVPKVRVPKVSLPGLQKTSLFPAGKGEGGS